MWRSRSWTAACARPQLHQAPASGSTDSGIQIVPATKSPAASKWARRHEVPRGHLAAVGCMVDSCQHCGAWQSRPRAGPREGPPSDGRARPRTPSGPIYGGYSETITVKESFTLKVPASLDLAATAPLLCAGHHHLLAATPLEGRQRPEGRHRGTRRFRSHGSEVRKASARKSCSSRLRRTRSRTGGGLARTKWSCQKMPRR